MSASNPSALKSRLAPTRFDALIGLRREWRAYHEKQDRDNAERVFREAGVEGVGDAELESFPLDLRAKLGEFGRDWERALAVEAHREGCAFYRLEFTIAVDQVTALSEWIENRLALSGASLFFESDGLEALKGNRWDAVFYFAWRSETPPETLGIEAAPGVLRGAKIRRLA